MERVSKLLTPLGLCDGISQVIDLLNDATGEFEATEPLGSLLGCSDGSVELVRCDYLYLFVENCFTGVERGSRACSCVPALELLKGGACEEQGRGHLPTREILRNDG